MKRSVPRRKFLVARSHQRTPKVQQLVVPDGINGKKLFDGRSVRDLRRILPMAHQLFQSAKKEHLHTNCLRNRAHVLIVTCPEATSSTGFILCSLNAHEK